MDDLNQVWKIGDIDFHLASGDLFECPVRAIVNSEQTDFILARNRSLISGQIRHRFGNEMQKELNAQVRGETLPAGTMIRTGPAGPYECIYHAGFHEPGDWELSEEAQSEHLVAIRRCVRQVLDDMAASGVESVAFPLIGCGLFGASWTILQNVTLRAEVLEGERTFQGFDLYRELIAALRGTSRVLVSRRY